MTRHQQKHQDFGHCHMPEVYCKMYSKAGIHLYSENCWFPLLPLWMGLPTHTLLAACRKQPKKAAAPLVRCCQGTAKNSGSTDCITDMCPCQQVSKGWLGNSALQHYKKLNRSNFPCSSPVLKKFSHCLAFSTLLLLSRDVGQFQVICLCYCFLSKGHCPKE